MRRWFLIGGLLAVGGVTILVLLLAGNDGGTTDKKPVVDGPAEKLADRPLEVTVVPVLAKQLDEKVRLPGELHPYLSVDLYPKVTGLLEWIAVDRGSIVKRGDVLVRLMAPELSAQRAEAEAKLQSDRVTYERLKTAAATPGVVSPNELQVAKRLVEGDRARMQSLKELEGYLVVKAPFDGVVTTRNVHLGALVGPAGGGGAGANPPLVRVEQISHLRLTVPVPEPYAGSIEVGKQVTFTVPAYPGRRFEGTISRIAHSVDTKTRTMPVEMDVDNSSGSLAPGMFPAVEWPVQRSEPTLFVPMKAVVTTTELTFVIRVRGDVAEWITVQKGLPVGNLMEVFGDLTADDYVVARGTDELRQGTKVKTISSSGT